MNGAPGSNGLSTASVTHRALALAAMVLGALLLVAAITSSPLQVVANRGWPLSGTSIVVHWTMVAVVGPIAAVPLALFVGGPARCHLRRAGAALYPAALCMVSLGTVAVWLAFLARHDRALTALQAVMVLVVTLVPWCRRSALLRASAVGTIVGSGLAVVSYGALWGETRCEEGGAVRCLAAGGPRIWVPRWLEAAGVPVFARLPSADLRGVDLRGRDLRLADLSGARLEAARLDGSNLRRARLDRIDAPRSSWLGAYLDGASVRYAHLVDSDLRGVHAFRVDLRGTDLTAADIRLASLSHAELARARLDRAQLQGTYLRFTQGWSSVSRAGATIDSMTLLPVNAPDER